MAKLVNKNLSTLFFSFGSRLESKSKLKERFFVARDINNSSLKKIKKKL